MWLKRMDINLMIHNVIFIISIYICICIYMCHIDIPHVIQIGFYMIGTSVMKELKGTWGQSNNFCVKLSFLTMKQIGSNQNFQKFACNPQLAYYVCSFSCMTSLTSRHYSKFRDFISSWEIVKTTMWKVLLL